MGLFGKIVAGIVTATTVKAANAAIESSESKTESRKNDTKLKTKSEELSRDNKSLDNLSKLHQLYKQNIITEKEYKKKRKKILDEV